MLNGIDVSNWQRGINLSAVPADFVIMKATEGTYFVSNDCNRQYQQAKSAGKLLGVYHYADGGDVKAEADFFLKNVAGYIGEAILCLDWENQNNMSFGKNDKAWVKSWCDYVTSKTGVKPIVYCSASVLSRLTGIGDYGFWVAQYANNNPTGYQSTPWNEGKYACVIRQYSSCGTLSGYSGRLDLNKFYGDRNAWMSYVGKKNVAEKPKTVTLPTEKDGIYRMYNPNSGEHVFTTDLTEANSLMDAGWNLNCDEVFAFILNLLHVEEDKQAEVMSQLNEYFTLRLKNIFQDKGMDYHIIDCVLASDTLNASEAAKRARARQSWGTSSGSMLSGRLL